MERKTDSAGNEQQFYYYPGGAVLYFAHISDSMKEYQPIQYEDHVPIQLYGSKFYKGIDSTNRYWRENRSNPFRAGYRFVHPGNDWIFDSSLNHFSLQPK